MQKEVLVEVSGLQMIDENGNEEPIQIIVPGEYYLKNGCHYLRYEEILDETAEPTVNYVKVSTDGIEVRKKGLVNVQMVFECGRKTMALYTTPFGTMEMGISATSLTFQETEDEIKIDIAYALEMNTYHVANCALSITVTPRNREGIL